MYYTNSTCYTKVDIYKLKETFTVCSRKEVTQYQEVQLHVAIQGAKLLFFVCVCHGTHLPFLHLTQCWLFLSKAQSKWVLQNPCGWGLSSGWHTGACSWP